ncbi:hypothetical protein THMIRHAS_04340 [Thiosulfatimonas sediminis]|uniref:Lipoprotein n=1 Tax=Thiosulfatimonas sediminis TaxID=2675054 RepID=A0A6F8PSF4_9GAMM|nr:hypothetical protein [Thiosulfatimonas sediminis]BBP45061.1 hypothetical protein THMIRHAS_04340 [Thiosulfatimonas sediminis]
MISRFLLISFFTLPLLYGCSSNPVGMNDEQWKQLSPQAREQLLLKQQQIDAEQARVQQDADNRARELQLQVELEEKKRLQHLYKNPMQSNVVRVNILQGEMQRDKVTWQLRPESFSIARSENKAIQLQLRNPQNGKTQSLPAYLHYRQEGSAVELQLYRQASNDQIRFVSDGKWDCGAEYKQRLAISGQEQLQIKAYIEELGVKPMYCKLRKQR